MRSYKLVLFTVLFMALSAPAFAQMDGPPPPPPGGHMHHDMAGHFMHEFDLNNDGKVTRAEYDQVNAERFRKMDKNGDGVITSDELAQFHPDGPPPPPPGQ